MIRNAPVGNGPALNERCANRARDKKVKKSIKNDRRKGK